jgi:hypothetical protein
MTPKELIKEYETWYEQLVVYPHFKAHLDVVHGFYVNEVNPDCEAAYRHGFIECLKMIFKDREENMDGLRATLITLATTTKGAEIKNCISEIKMHYAAGNFN